MRSERKRPAGGAALLRGLGWAGLVAATACGGDSTAPVATCTAAAATHVALAVAQYVAIDPANDQGCVSFPANASTTDSAEYLVVAQSASGTPGDNAPFQLASANLAAMVTAQRAPTWIEGSTALAFDRFLREAGRARRYPATPVPPPAPPPGPVSAALAPPTPPLVGDTRTFKVCANLACSSLASDTAVARAVVGHVAIYVDKHAPPPPFGLDSAQIDTLAQLFEQHVYMVDTTHFGREPDIDNNGVVIALMTPTVNSLVTASQCQSTGFVAGFFFSADIDPMYRSSYNNGEIIYSVVADSLGQLSCSHTPSQVMRLLPGTFIHELQHLINFTQHVLVAGGPAETVWLDEALSRYAEELGGRSFLPSDSADFINFVSGDTSNARRYLQAPHDRPMVTNTDEVLADVGAGWLFLRYLADQFGDSISPALVQTSLVGATNVATHTGQPFDMTVERWALANWVSDLAVAGFTPPPELRYTSWSFRQTYPSYPLVPLVSGGGDVTLSGTLHAGSGSYVRVLQGPSGPGFNLLFSSGGSVALPAHIVPRLDVIRIR